MRHQVRFFFASIMLILGVGTTRADTRYYLEVDPIAYVLKGYSLHAGMQTGQFRFQAGIFGATLPEGARDNPAFEVSMKGFGIKADYTGEQPDGWFVGMELEHSTMDYKHQNESTALSRDAQFIGLRTGYKYEFGKRFFLTPWVAIKRNISELSLIEIGGDKYQESAWLVFPTVHLGMHF